MRRIQPSAGWVELFAWASIETVELSYPAAGGGKTKRVREVVISMS